MRRKKEMERKVAQDALNQRKAAKSSGGGLLSANPYNVLNSEFNLNPFSPQGLSPARTAAYYERYPMEQNEYLNQFGGDLQGAPQLNVQSPDPMSVFGPPTFQQMYPYIPRNYGYLPGHAPEHLREYEQRGQNLYDYPENSIEPFVEDYIRRPAEIMNGADPSLMNPALMAARHQGDLLNAPGTFDALGDITQQYGLPGEIGGEIADFLYGSNPTRANFGLPPLNRPQSLSASRYNANPFDISNDFNLPDYLQPQNMPTNPLTGQMNPSYWQQQPSMGAMPQFQGFPRMRGDSDISTYDADMGVWY